MTLCVTAMILFSASCKKSGGGDRPDDPYRANDGSFTATIDGTNWKASSVYAVDSANIIYVLATASNSTTNAYPFVLMSFPDNMAQGASLNFDFTNASTFQFYQDESTIYWADPIMGGSGSVTIKKINKSTRRVEGNFSAVLKTTTAAAGTKNITNGSFAVNYR